ncbi:hypothetical protein EVAR_42600_1 [Eumeta japonica]|uniref:Uncharacterized protein n=1 Tax=Eumeta variegata TaxID=151549 RepID=A0A4C1XNE5_EUMVA|nr:hypothetical protein EVAR_42600_1 [Eumeta japonica]
MRASPVIGFSYCVNFTAQRYARETGRGGVAFPPFYLQISLLAVNESGRAVVYGERCRAPPLSARRSLRGPAPAELGRFPAADYVTRGDRGRFFFLFSLRAPIYYSV